MFGHVLRRILKKAILGSKTLRCRTNTIAAQLRATEGKGKTAEKLLEHVTALRQSDDRNAAALAFGNAVAADPNIIEAHFQLAGELESQERVPEAIAALHSVLSRDMQFSGAHYKLGSLLFRMGDVDGAMAEFRREIELTPNSAAAYAHLGFAHFWLGQIEVADALYLKALELDSTNRWATLLRLQLHFNQGNDALAQEIWEQACSSATGHASDREEHGLPVLLFAIPKSASSTMVHTISQSTGLPIGPDFARHTDPAAKSNDPKYDFLSDIGRHYIVPWTLDRICVGKPEVFRTHIGGNEHNYQVLNDSPLNKIWIHLRDPRQIILSRFYHMEKYRGLYDFNKIGPNALSAYLGSSRREKIEYLARRHLAANISWINSWLSIEAMNRRFEMVVTHYDDFLRRGPEKFITEVLGFFGYYDRPVELKVALFNQGDPDAWRREIEDSALKKWMWEQIPVVLKDRFGWKA